MVTPAQARKRRTFAAIIAVVVVSGAFALSRDPRPAVTAAVATAAEATPSLAPAPSASSPGAFTSSRRMPPAWLAWISGSLPPGFARQAATTPALGAVVIVAGDTRWMSASHDADGTTVDRPEPPYRIPIDAFAVDPDAYAPFLPEAYRERVRAALSDGRAVLGRSSARLRRLDVGGSLTFDGGTVQVGAVVPDDVAGWSEMLVSRAVGAALGIVDDRYLLSMPPRPMIEPRFASIMASLIPGTNIRTVRPGGSSYMRIASGVHPPIVIKGVFGEFAAYPRSDDPAYLNMSPDWYDTHIVSRSVPLLGRVTCNEAFLPALSGALAEVEASGLGGKIHTYSGCYAARTIARSATAPPSYHAYGAAIDINAPENPYGATPTMDRRIVAIFERWGFLWGGNYLTPDGMHFEYGGPPHAAN